MAHLSMTRRAAGDGELACGRHAQPSHAAMRHRISRARASEKYVEVSWPLQLFGEATRHMSHPRIGHGTASNIASQLEGLDAMSLCNRKIPSSCSPCNCFAHCSIETAETSTQRKTSKSKLMFASKPMAHTPSEAVGQAGIS
jgi:hypothetical protein